MSVGIIQYPGSNCDYDTLRYFDDSFLIWHKETVYPENLKLLVIPGGFAFGDRIYDNATGSFTISPGIMAINSPVSRIILEANKQNIPILGICNGFQILIHMGLLPGKLLLNRNGKFTCKKVKCRLNYKIPKNEDENEDEDKDKDKDEDEDEEITYNTKFYIANSYGQYDIEGDNYETLISNDQIFLTYDENLDEVNSIYNIAGICNKKKNIFGMMPHPERNNSDFKSVLYKILFPKDPFVDTQFYFHTKIEELMHSEHISYKSTRQYLKLLHTEAPWVVQGPGENAGIVDIGNGYCIAIRIESHNHPTFINPFEGAATGVGGILRDIFTMGARPIAIMDFLRFGTDNNSEQLLEKTIDGISYYGNCIGVPNIGGDCYVDSIYNKNPLVNIACLGIVKKENIIYGNATGTNQILIYVGSKTGNEGIGGAAMASKAFNSETDIDDMQHNVQKSDPFLEKLLMDACCEIAEKQLVIGMQDMGAGGLLCASHEMIRRGIDKSGENLGCNIHLNRVPIKYDMELCNILISESQERMLIIASPEKKHEIFDIFDKWDLEYAEIGETTFDGKYTVYNNDTMLYTETMCNYKDINENWDIKKINNLLYSDQIKKIKNMDLWKVYDSTVGNRTLKGPDKPGSYSILDIYENNKKLVLTWAENFNDCYTQMTTIKAIPLCIVNCLNFGHPEDSMSDFVNTISDLQTNCKKYNIPIVGGNVSLYNSTDNKSIRPTPILVMMGLIN